MDYVNLSASMTMLELVRFLLQERNDSFSFYSGKLCNLNEMKENPENCKKFSSVCQYICKKVREVWSVHNVGIISVEGEMMICVTSTEPSEPAEAVSFMLEAIAVCFASADKSRITETDQTFSEEMDEDIPPDMIQISASMKEINERIEQFVRYKREQANANNVLDFCGSSTDRQHCARVDAILVRKKDSSSHMAVRNVLDRYTAKHNLKKQQEMEVSQSVAKASQEPTEPSKIVDHSDSSSLLQQTVTCGPKGEKRRFDIASLESMLNSVKKQQKT